MLVMHSSSSSVMTRLSLCCMMMILAALWPPLHTASARAEELDSNLVIEIGHISQPYNCTLFLDNLEVGSLLGGVGG